MHFYNLKRIIFFVFFFDILALLKFLFQFYFSLMSNGRKNFETLMKKWFPNIISVLSIVETTMRL